MQFSPFISLSPDQSESETHMVVGLNVSISSFVKTIAQDVLFFLCVLLLMGFLQCQEARERPCFSKRGDDLEDKQQCRLARWDFLS